MNKTIERNIEQFLHHRRPYLQVDEILDSSSSHIETTKSVKPDELYISGHFPGAPVVPGAMMQEMCTQSAGILIAKHYNPMDDFDTTDPFHNQMALGVLRSVKDAKYYTFAKVGDDLNIHVRLINHLDNLFKFEGKIYKGDQKVMRISFSLCNTQSELLY
jgi:3-hydroxyacyl-[acyl-carrier-protein] dehydratase